MIEFEVHLQRSHFALDLSASFGDGVTGIYGPSGSGKTSLLHLLAGLIKPQSGRIRINSRMLSEPEKGIWLPPEKRNIGFVFQEGRLFPHLSVQQNLLFAKNRKRGGRLSVRFDDVVAMLEIDHLLKKQPGFCSGGERQRVAIGRALLSNPEVLLMDEPFSAVDVNLRQQILPFIQRVAQNYRIPMVIVSHDLPDILKLTDQLALVREGKIIGHGAYHDLVLQPACQTVLEGAGLVNILKFTVQEELPGEDMVVLLGPGRKNRVKVLCERNLMNSKPGKPATITLKPDDIILSIERVKNISAQNQLPGVVHKMMSHNGQRLCIVDVGFPLMAEVTEASARQMNLTPGTPVWCLFKSLALKVAGCRSSTIM